MTAASCLAGRRILVVGGAGVIGSNLVRAALADGCREVVLVDNLLSADRANIPADARVTFVEGSIADDVVLGRLDPGPGASIDYVFHLATFHGNQNSIADPLADHDNNLITTLKLFERIRTWPRLAKVVYAASGCTLAPHTWDHAEPTTEDGPVPFELDSPYQISKVVGEFYSVYYHRQHGLPVVRARFQNVYGPGEILGAGQWRGTAATVWRNVTPVFIYRALRRLPLELDNGGQATRDFIHVDDVVRGLVLAASRGEPGDVYNLASGVETSILELARLVDELTGNPTPREVRPRRTWDHAGKRVGSTDKAKRLLGFEAQVGLRDGLERTIAWTRDHMPLIERSIANHASRLPAG